jgi:NRPS condensation-like uncharacterized protein
MAILDRTSPVGFHAIWDLVGSVDLESLSWAWQALTRIHPILACTADVAGATWRSGADPPTINRIEGGREVDRVTESRVAVPVDLTNGPIIRLDVITRFDGMRLLLAAHHAAFDGAASVVLIDDLRTLYLARCTGNAQPIETIEADRSPRTVKAALRQQMPSRVTGQSFISQSLDRWRRLPASTHIDPPGGSAQEATGYASIDLRPALAAIDEKRRRNSWPIDAVLVGLMEAAWNDVFGPNEDVEGVWLVSSNLRPGLGMTRGIGNLSGVEAIAVSRARPLDASIEQAAAEIAAARSGFPGLGPELMARTWGWLPPPVLNQGVDMMIRAGQRQRYTRIISNMGRLPDSLADWGQARMEDIRYLGPMTRAPYTMIVALSFGTSTSLTVRTAPNWLTPDHVRELESAINRHSGIAHPPSAPASSTARGVGFNSLWPVTWW